MAVHQSHSDCGVLRPLVVCPHDAASNVRCLIAFPKSGPTGIGLKQTEAVTRRAATGRWHYTDADGAPNLARYQPDATGSAALLP
ncbi:hypothetical protein Bind_0323 [Beijerinckia indica subsp. indica ATCC 9039]|uniref:Uncharacterized protein n=1 Tax=Beijerinckia indica subsp. indica (strain ATCC 9039 / DSM 1715 / NCIMB 8712) TaxID=395963 RepID=B2IDC5_BEII9|nr:hypothetical protein Bind_0323 [Beijerinckia indica subsp. indica ATCC 9039]